MGKIKLKSKEDDNGMWGYVDEAGNWVIEPKYDFASDFSEGLAHVYVLGKKHGFIDQTGKEVIPRIYDEAWDFSEGLAVVELDEKYGYIDQTGKEIVPCIYDNAGDFSEGLAFVELDEKYGYIDQTGKVVIPGIYDDAEDFRKGLARVRLDGKGFYIDKNGNRVVRNDFKSIKKLEGQIEKAKEKRKDLILTEGVDFIIERMRKNDITSIDLQKLDSDWGYGTISTEYKEVYLTLKLNDDGRLYYIAQGYGFEDGELYLDDEPSDEEVVDSNISDKLLDYLKELAEDSMNPEEEDYIVEYEGEGEADIDEIRYRL